MKPDEINIAIAEFCGFSPFLSCGVPMFCDPKNHFNLTEIPNYYGDLNACRDALIKLSEEQKGVYPHHLESLTHSGKHYTDFYTFSGSIAFATAPQVCEAILNTIDKWRDGQ